MFGYTRMKRVTDPFDDMAKARIFGRDKTGPDHVSQHTVDDVTALASLSELFYGFDAGESSPAIGDPDFDRDDRPETDSISAAAAAVDLIETIVESQRDAFGDALAAHVRKAAQAFAPSSGKPVVRRNVVAYLRNCGYDAAICKTKWEKCGGLTAGDYEFIDVLRAAGPPARYLVDLDFAAEFEIARPTECYERLMRHLPEIFVGTGDCLRQILRVASDAARRSLKSGGLHLPPWRRHRFMQNKWLGPCRRTANVFPAVKQGYGVMCRAVGFDAAVNGGGGHFLFPATTARTRWFGWEN